MTKNQLKKIIKKCLNEMYYERDPRDEPIEEPEITPTNIRHVPTGRTNVGGKVSIVLNDLINKYVKNPKNLDKASAHAISLVKIIDDNQS